MKNFKKTNLFIIDKELWNWAKYQATVKEFNSVSEYVFDLIRQNKEKK